MAGDLDRFKSTLVYKTQATAEELMADVGLMRKFDKQSEDKIKAYKTITLVSILSVFGAFVLTVVTQLVWFLFAIPIAIVCAITGGVLWAARSKFDLANRRYELYGELVRLLSRDMAKDARFTVELDLAPANHASKKTNEGQAAGWKVSYFVDPWLKLNGRFADGTSFQIMMTEKFQARGKWKRSRSGKNKWKSKSKGSTQASVRLFPKQKNYKNIAAVTNNAVGFLKLPPWVTVKSLEATADELSLTTVTFENWSAGQNEPQTPYDATAMLAMMLLSMYQILHSSKAVSRS